MTEKNLALNKQQNLHARMYIHSDISINVSDIVSKLALSCPIGMKLSNIWCNYYFKLTFVIP